MGILLRYGQFDHTRGHRWVWRLSRQGCLLRSALGSFHDHILCHLSMPASLSPTSVELQIGPGHATVRWPGWVALSDHQASRRGTPQSAPMLYR